MRMLCVVALLLAAPAWAQLAPETRSTVCKDGYVAEEVCRVIDGETFCTLKPVEDLKRGLAVRGCSDMTVLGTVAMLTAAHMSDLWTTSYGIDVKQNAVEVNPLGQTVEQRVALKLAVIATGTLSIHLTAKKNPKLARKVRAGTVAALALIAGRNMYVALKDRDDKSVPLPVAVTVSW